MQNILVDIRTHEHYTLFQNLPSTEALKNRSPEFQKIDFNCSKES
jgi:hypothetical protein